MLKELEFKTSDKIEVTQTEIEGIQEISREITYFHPAYEELKNFENGLKFPVIYFDPLDKVYYGEINFHFDINYSENFRVKDEFASFNLETGDVFSSEEIGYHFEHRSYHALGELTNSYGVADSVEQIKELYKHNIDNPDFDLILCVSPIYKSSQPEKDGWRWEKWGNYIGNHVITEEYLYDEKDIDKVILFHFYLVEKK